MAKKDRFVTCRAPGGVHVCASMPMRAESANDGPSSEQQKKKIEPIVRQAAGQMAVDEEVSIDL
jgi:hypothetical protein